LRKVAAGPTPVGPRTVFALRALCGLLVPASALLGLDLGQARVRVVNLRSDLGLQAFLLHDPRRRPPDLIAAARELALLHDQEGAEVPDHLFVFDPRVAGKDHIRVWEWVRVLVLGERKFDPAEAELISAFAEERDDVAV
jgi:hypothetical protein